MRLACFWYAWIGLIQSEVADAVLKPLFDGETLADWEGNQRAVS